MYTPISEQDFLNIFTTKVYKKIIKESSIVETNISYREYKNYLKDLYASIVNSSYFPDNPRDYLLLPKTKYVARTISLLTYKDESFYYFVCKMIEDDIAQNRVENTFGGWRLGGKFKVLEEDDLCTIRYVHNSYSPFLWNENWKKFFQIAKTFADSKKYRYVLKLDISNFYDSINLNILLNKLYKVVAKEKAWCIDCLSFFLKYWNKKIDNYLPRSQGLPQTEFGDQSRLLANFYLQDYDESVKNACDANSIEYVRYADDQLLFLQDIDYKDVLLIINIELNKIGLNLNSAKCKLLTIEKLSEYYLFGPLSLIDEKRYDDSMQRFLAIYDGNNNIRYDTYLKRIVSNSVGLSLFSKALTDEFVKKIVFNTDVLLSCNCKQIKAIYDYLDDKDKSALLLLLEKNSKEVKFNYVEITTNKLLSLINPS